MIAHFDAAGRAIAVGDIGTLPGTEYSAEVPDGTNPNSIYYVAGVVVERQPFPITVGAGEIIGIPAGTVARISGVGTEAVDNGTLELPGGGWVRLEHPHFLDWAGNVPVELQP